MTTTKEMNSVSVRIDEINDLVASGQLDPKAVSKQLQIIFDSEVEINVTGSALPREQGLTQINPWRSAEQQIDRAERLFPYTHIYRSHRMTSYHVLSLKYYYCTCRLHS